MQLPLDALARRTIYCQIIHEDKLADHCAARLRHFGGIFGRNSRSFGVLLLCQVCLLAASESGKLNNIGRISPSLDLVQTTPRRSIDVLLCALVLDFLVFGLVMRSLSLL